jgi:7-cyano-7-deazaguanine synthase
MIPDSVAIVSGGLDSVTLVYDLISQGYRPHLLSFNYGQRHQKELTYAAQTAERLGLRHDIVDLQGLTHLISNSALTSQPLSMADGMNEDTKSQSKIEVPEGHYAEDTMKATVVPNRNMIMLSIAAGVAVNNKYRAIAIGVHGGDHFIYPDCRPEFIYQAAKAIWSGNDGFHQFRQGSHGHDESRGGVIYAPYIYKSKADIAYRALELGVPLHLTWSCYKGGKNHCGRCGTCVERLEAIHEAIGRFKEYYGPEDVLADKTVYDDKEYWRVAIYNAMTGDNK